MLPLLYQVGWTNTTCIQFPADNATSMVLSIATGQYAILR